MLGGVVLIFNVENLFPPQNSEKTQKNAEPIKMKMHVPGVRPCDRRALYMCVHAAVVAAAACVCNIFSTAVCVHSVLYRVCMVTLLCAWVLCCAHFLAAGLQRQKKIFALRG